MKPNEPVTEPVLTTGTILSDSTTSDRHVSMAGALSVALHVSALTIALIPWPHAVRAPKQTVTEVVLYAPPLLNLPALREKSGGGGGGMHTPTPPSLGRLPRAAEKQLVPPAPEVKNAAPELIAEPTIVAKLINFPQISLLPLGDPEGVPGPPSPGPGSGGGVGTGNGHGDGGGDGPGAGPGKNGGIGADGDGPYTKGSVGGLTMPKPLYTPDPDYSEDARKARFQGVVTLQAVVRKDGSVDVVGVVHSPGYGLDQEAVKSVRQWRFRPGTRNGRPVDIQLSIEVNFRIL